MTRGVLAVRPGTELCEAAQLMHEQKIGALPVVDADRVVGILDRERRAARVPRRPRGGNGRAPGPLGLRLAMSAATTSSTSSSMGSASARVSIAEPAPIRGMTRDPTRVLVVGTGQMGSAIARVVLDRPGLLLVGAFGKRAERAGTDLGQAIGLGRDLGFPIRVDLDAAVEASQPHVAIQATCSRLIDAAGEIATLVRHGIHVVSIAEEMVYQACAPASLAEELHRLAVAHRVSILGTGINPGFVLDVLVIALTAVCSDIRSITATRVNDLSPYGPTVLRSQGVGLTVEAFREGLVQAAWSVISDSRSRST